MSDFLYKFAWNNPFNLYAPVSGRTTFFESVASQVAWSSIPLAAYGVGYAMVGTEAVAGVSYYNLTYLVGGGALTAWSFGMVTALAMAHHVHTDPVLKARMERQFSPGQDIFKTTGFGGMSL